MGLSVPHVWLRHQDKKKEKIEDKSFQSEVLDLLLIIAEEMPPTGFITLSPIATWGNKVLRLKRLEKHFFGGICSTPAVLPPPQVEKNKMLSSHLLLNLRSFNGCFRELKLDHLHLWTQSVVPGFFLENWKVRGCDCVVAQMGQWRDVLP